MYDREYEYIMAIAQTGTLSRAAVSLGISSAGADPLSAEGRADDQHEALSEN